MLVTYKAGRVNQGFANGYLFLAGLGGAAPADSYGMFDTRFLRLGRRRSGVLFLLPFLLALWRF